MRKMSRRQLLKSAATGAVGAIAVPYFVPSGVLAADGRPGANDRVTVGAIGVGNRAQSAARSIARRRADLSRCATAICHVPRRTSRRAKAIGRCTSTTRRSWNGKDIDAVIIATQEFQRVLPSHPRLPGRQGCLRREAADVVRSRGPCAGRHGAEARSRVPGRFAAADRWP